MKIKFTNFFANRDAAKQKSKEIDIKGNCVITNYNPSTHSPNGAKDLTVSVKGDAVTVQKGRSVFVEGNQVDFNETKYSIFERLALQDGNSNDLTETDLKKAAKNFRQGCKLWELGVVSITYDENTGKAVVKIGSNQVLHIDFETDKEKAAVSKANTVRQKDSTETKPKQQVASVKPQTTQAKSEKAVTASKENEAVAKVISKFRGGNIDISEVKDMATVAQYTGVSENYIKEILVGIEGKNNWPLVKAEYDGVKDKKHPKGYLTIAFGHTSLIGEPKVKEGMEISVKQAYQILANDIIQSKKYAKHELGDLYDNIPESMQNAAIDLVFNKGPKAVNNDFKKALKDKNYSKAALCTWYDTPNIGLQKRNMFRFIESIKGLSKGNKKAALQGFKKMHTAHLLMVFKKDSEARKVWNNLCTSLKYTDGFFSVPQKTGKGTS